MPLWPRAKLHTLYFSHSYNIRPTTCFWIPESSVASKTAITLSTVRLDLKYHFCCQRKRLSKILRATFILSNVFLQLEDNLTCYLLITLLSFHYFLPLKLIDSVLNSHFSTDKTCLSRSSASSYQIPEQATAHPPLGLSQAPQLQYIPHCALAPTQMFITVVSTKKILSNIDANKSCKRRALLK